MPSEFIPTSLSKGLLSSNLNGEITEFNKLIFENGIYPYKFILNFDPWMIAFTSSGMYDLEINKRKNSF